jgi:transposase
MKQYRRTALAKQAGDDQGHVRILDAGALQAGLPLSFGMDIGDRKTEICVLDCKGDVEQRAQIPTTRVGLRRFFERAERGRVALEVGTHSSWIQRELDELGFETYVANARKLRAIWDNDSKTDRTDAQLLGEIVQLKPSLLRPIQHRGKEGLQDLKLARARSLLVRTRTMMISHVRGAVKATGHRLSSCASEAFYKRVDDIPEELKFALEPVMKQTGEHTALIRGYDAAIRKRAAQVPAVALLTQVPGVGELTALTFVSIIEDPARFPKARKVAGYLGLRPRLDDSGDTQKQLGITKAGDKYLRVLLVQCAQYILGPFSPDTDLKRWGTKLAERGGKNAKKRAVVAVARKLSVLLLTLWKTGDKYEPLIKAKQKEDIKKECPDKGPTPSLAPAKDRTQKMVRSTSQALPITRSRRLRSSVETRPSVAAKEPRTKRTKAAGPGR